MFAEADFPLRHEAINAGMPEFVYQWFALVADGLAADTMELWDGNEVWSCRLMIDGKSDVISILKDVGAEELTPDDAQQTIEKCRALMMAAISGDIAKPQKPN